MSDDSAQHRTALENGELVLAGGLRVHGSVSPGILKLAREHDITKYEPEWSKLIGYDTFKSHGFDGYSEYVAVMDSGIDQRSPAISENFLTGFSFLPEDRVPCLRGGRKDSFFHGTTVCGTILQMMPRVNVISLKVINQLTGASDVLWWVAAFKKLMRYLDRKGLYGVPVNISLGVTESARMEPGIRKSLKQLESIIAHYLTDYGGYVIAAGGNERALDSPRSFPAAFDNVISFGSVLVDCTDNGYRIDMSAFSNVNPYVDFLALGENFWTFFPNSNIDRFRRMYQRPLADGMVRLSRIDYKHRKQWMVEVDGSSYGSPAGCALIIGWLQELKAKGAPAPTQNELMLLLKQSSHKLTDGAGRDWFIPTCTKAFDTATKRLSGVNEGYNWIIEDSAGHQPVEGV